MIKPDTLANLFATCDNSSWVGDICRALGGQKVELDYGQRQVLAQIQLDSEAMDGRMAEQKARWAERQRRKRQKDKDDVTQCHGDISMSRDVTVTNGCHGDSCDSHDVTNHPSIQPTIHPSIHTTTSVVVNNSTPLTDDEMSYLSESVQVPAAYLQTFINRMTELGWQYITRSGVTVTVTRENFKAVLRKFYEWDQRKRSQVQQTVLKQDGYEADMERA